MERLRQRRQEELDRGDLGGAFREIAAGARGGRGRRARRARSRSPKKPGPSGDERRRRSPTRSWPSATSQLDLLPADLAGPGAGPPGLRLRRPPRRASTSSSCSSACARRWRKSWFDQMSEALTNPDPEQLERVRQMLDALNRMIEQREQGEPLDPSFEQFMEQFGEFFPGNPKDLDELLEQFAAQMAAVQAALDSMSPEQRAQLQALAESLFEDMDLRWQVDRLAGEPAKAVPGAGWGRRYRYSGSDPMGLADAAASARQAGRDGPARAVPALGGLARSAGRGRPGPGGEVPGRRRGPLAAAPRPPGQASSRRPASSSSARAATS